MAEIAGTEVKHQDADHPAIRLGSTGPNVETWQKIIGVTADGQFGPATETATRAWQASHGVTADGIVGPLTWSTAGVANKVVPAGGYTIGDMKTSIGVSGVAIAGAAIGGPIGFLVGGGIAYLTRNFWRAKL